MKISKRRLSILIENYLFEAEEGSKPAKDNEDVKVKAMTIEYDGITAELAINKNKKQGKQGGVTFKVSGEQGQTDEATLSKKNVAGINPEKAKFVELVSGLYQDLKRTGNKQKADDIVSNLKPFIYLTDEVTGHMPSKVVFDAKFKINKPGYHIDNNANIA